MQAQQLPYVQPMVVVLGEGVVKVIPDGVLIISRIENEGQDPQEVKRKNDAGVNAVLKYLKSQGISSKNVQTDYLNLNKQYNYENKTYSYVANQSIAVKLDDLKNYEKIMSGLLEAGLNRIDGIEFKSSQMEAHKAEARKRAVLNARKKAQEYAETLGQKIGKAITISEMEKNNFSQVYRMNEMMKSSDDVASEETLAPGEMEVHSRVSVGFHLD